MEVPLPAEKKVGVATKLDPDFEGEKLKKELSAKKQDAPRLVG